VAVGAQPAAAQPSEVQIGNAGGIWAPAVAASGDQQDVFELSTRHTVVRWRATGASALARDDLGGYAVDGVAAARSGTGVEVVLVRGADSAVWYRQRTGDGPWSGWRSLGGRVTSRPVAANRPGSDLIIVEVRGTNGALYERVFDASGTWSPGWRPVNAVVIGVTAVGGLPAGGFRAWVQGSDGRVFLGSRPAAAAGGWSWQPSLIPLPSPQRPRFDLADMAMDAAGTGVLYLLGSQACWAYAPDDIGPVSLGGRFESGFAALTTSTGTLVYGRGVNHKLYVRTGGGWHLLGSP
jgi:hypothetical protein